MENSPRAGLSGELALLLLLATLWGASYSFIKVGVATIPPITLIAGRTLIAGVLLLLIMRWRGVSMPTDGATWGRFAFQACLNSVVPWTLIAWGEGTVDATTFEGKAPGAVLARCRALGVPCELFGGLVAPGLDAHALSGNPARVQDDLAGLAERLALARA